MHQPVLRIATKADRAAPPSPRPSHLGQDEPDPYATAREAAQMLARLCARKELR